MSDERHNPRIRRVQLEKINPDEVVVYMTASSGAMGDAGAVEFYSIHFGQVLYFYGNVLNGLDMEEVDKHIPADIREFEIFGGGMGNIFRIRKEYYPELQKRLEAYTPPYRYYRNCVVPLEDYLLEIAAGGKDIGLSAILADYELTSRFERVSHENGLSAETVLRNFIKDYIVSGGHSEAVNNLWRRE